jgi:hypothetical protein
LGGKIDIFEVKEKMGKHFASTFGLEFISWTAKPSVPWLS